MNPFPAVNLVNFMKLYFFSRTEPQTDVSGKRATSCGPKIT